MINQVWDTLGSETLIIVAGREVEDYGTVTLDWTDPVLSEPIGNCSVQPVGGTQINLDREAIITRYQVFIPGHIAGLSGVNRIRWRGSDYEIDGATPYFPDPLNTGLDHHVFYIVEARG